MLPEEVELERLESELSAIRDIVADKELALETTKGDLARFRARYQSEIVNLYVMIDRLDAIIARIDAGENPDDIEAQARAEEAKRKAEESAREAGASSEEMKQPSGPPKEPTREVKQAFRTGAKMMHPDLATDQMEKERRHTFMTRLNLAYEQCDLATIQTIITEFGEDPESIRGEDVGSRMIKVIRKLAQMRRRIDEISGELETINADDYYMLMKKVEEADADGGDALADLSVTLMQQISERKITLEEWRQKQAKS